MSGEWPETKAEFQQQLQKAWSELQQTLDSLTEEQLTRRVDAGGWTVKDHLAHLEAWERGIVALLNKKPRYLAMGINATDIQNKDEGELNRMLHQQHTGETLAEVREGLRRTHDELTALVDALPPDDLVRSYSHYQPDEPGEDTGEPVLRWVVGNSSGHYLEHLPWIRQIAGTSA